MKDGAANAMLKTAIYKISALSGVGFHLCFSKLLLLRREFREHYFFVANKCVIN